MSRVEQRESQIKQLTPEELSALRVWFADYDWDLWDLEIEADSASGKLDRLAEQALLDHSAGRTRRL